ncbi:ATP-dependent DNA helicase [Chloroflexi bacterium TSY]|nr:ATP-dependent DNA helicase [Chloroflexi bacterium TSY]
MLDSQRTPYDSELEYVDLDEDLGDTQAKARQGATNSQSRTHFDEQFVSHDPPPENPRDMNPLMDDPFFDAPPPDDSIQDHFEQARPKAKVHRPSQLEQVDLREFFGDRGSLAQHLDGYELRPSQLEMAESVKRALQTKQHALVEAPTGTGKSIAYLVPAILSGKTVVVATANKSLQSQLYYKEIPFLRKVLNLPISAVIVKGRSNFICTHKWEDEAFEQQRFAFVDKEHEQATFLRSWLNETDTGDVDDLPFMLDSDLRPRIVSYPDDCLHRDCRHYADNCWVNKMRDKAAEAQVLITNHHLLLNALELGWAGERLLPPAAIYIIDEAHQLEQTATSVFESTITDYAVEQLLRRNIFNEHLDSDERDQLLFHNTLAFQEVAHSHRDNAFRLEDDLEEMHKLATALDQLKERMRKENPYSEESGSSADDANHDQEERTKSDDEDEQSEQRRMYELAIEGLAGTVNKLLAVATSNRDDHFVRYAVRIFDRRHVSLELHAAPIDPAGLLHEFLFHPESDDGDDQGERTVICTSATLATNKHFNHFKQRCGIAQSGEEHILPAVFDYPQQALLYQPALPAFNYRNPEPYYEAVGAELERLLETSRGRALCLFTSWSGLQQARERLIESGFEPIWPLRAQGDAPRDALLEWFKATPHSVMLATKSFWEGVDIPGDDLSLVVLDKMPFPTPNDPLHSARMKAIDDAGRSSFGEYMLPLMTLTLKQGFGRLVRRATDRGVVAILDERLTSKSYGRQAQADLPPARLTRSFSDIHRFYRTALDSQADFALNVWATGSAEAITSRSSDPFGDGEPPDDGDDTIRWRWQLLRLQDGKADSAEGVSTEAGDLLEGEIYAMLEGLQNLRQRIEKAGRSAEQFGVELRCHTDIAQALEDPAIQGKLRKEARQEQALWKEVQIVTIPVNDWTDVKDTRHNRD